MFVAVDLGNSAVKFGAFDGAGRLVAVERVEAGRTLAEGVMPPPMLFGADEVVVLSSAPGRLPEFVAWCPVAVRVLGDDVRAAMRTTYARPAELGLDRIAAAAGARERTGASRVVIADVGTAVTVDAVTGDGVLVAVAIAPGLHASADGLRGAAPHLPRPDLRAGQVAVPARGTADSLRAGHVLGLAGLVDRLAEEAARAAGGPSVHLLCGGDAELLLPHLRTPFTHEPDLVLRGIRALRLAVPA